MGKGSVDLYPQVPWDGGGGELCMLASDLHICAGTHPNPPQTQTKENDLKIFLNDSYGSARPKFQGQLG